jgi:histidinol-phosphate aminotransferase
MQYRLDNVITLRTFSKAFGLAGVRIGYGFAHEELIANLMKIKLTFEPSAPAQAGAVAALNDDDFLEKTLHNNRLGKKYFYQLFDRLGLQYIKSFTNFVTLVFDSEKQVNLIFNRLLREGVIVRPLKSFGLPNCIRVSIGLPEENEFFAKKLEKIL